MTGWSASETVGAVDVSDGEVRYFGGDKRNTGEYRNGFELRQVPAEVWSFSTEENLNSLPIIADGTVYVTSDSHTLYAVSENNGTEQWMFDADLPQKETHIYGTPSINNNTVYVAFGVPDWPDEIDATQGTVISLDAETGEQNWQREFEEYFSSSPVYSEGSVYIGSWEGQLRSLDAETGETEWSYDGGIDRTVPAVTENAIYTVAKSANGLVKLDPDTGTQEWSFERGAPTRSSPAVVDSTVYIGHNIIDGEPGVSAVDTETGEERWSQNIGDPVTCSPSVGRGYVIIGARDNHVHALDAESGTVEWTFETGFWVTGKPAIVNETVYVGSWDGSLYLLDITDGTELASFDGVGGIRSGVVATDDRIYFASHGGSLYSLAAGTFAVITHRPDSVTAGEQVTVSGTESVADGEASIAQYEWAFGANSAFSSDGEETTTTFTETGEQTVRLRVTDSDGETDTTTEPITVLPEAPVARISGVPSAVEAGERFTLSGSESTVGGGLSITTYEWVFGAGESASATGREVTHSFATPGEYQLTLTVTDSEGRTDTVSQQLTVTAATAATETPTPTATPTPTPTETMGAGDDGFPVMMAGGAVTVGASAVGGAMLYRGYVGSGDESARTTDWPQTLYDAGQTAVAPDARAATPTAERWTRSGEVSTTPVVASGVVLTGTATGTIRATNNSTGELVWETEVGESVTTAPAVSFETVYAVTGSTLIALAVDDGSITWTAELGESVIGGPVIYEHTVYLAARDGRILAYSSKTGTMEWESELDDVPSAAVAVSDRGVFLGTEGGQLVALNRESGSVVWRVDIDGKSVGLPTLVDETVYLVTGDGTLLALDTDGETRWTVELDITPVAGPAGASDAVYVAGRTGGVVGVDDAGTVQWETDCDGTRKSGPAVLGETLYLPSGHELVGLDTETGTRQWGQSLSERPEGVAPTSDAVYAGTAAGLDGLPDEDRDTTEWGEAVERPDTGSGEASQKQNGDRKPVPDETVTATPATQFARNCEWIQSASSSDESGPIHVYDGVTAADGDAVRMLTLAPEYTDHKVADVFGTEIDRWEGISHNSHIVEVSKTGTEPRPWAAVRDYEARLADSIGELDRADRLRMLEEIIEGLRTADMYNVSHGNVHPGVVQLRTADGELSAAVGDWGLERAVNEAIDGMPVTPYTAPEQLEGGAVPATDVYQVGLIAYWLLTDREPFADSDELAAAIRAGELTPPSELVAVPESYDSVVEMATATDPAARYDSVSQLRDAIRSVFG